MTQKTVYVTLSEFCKNDDRPRKLLQEAGFIVKENTTGRRIKREEMMDALKTADGVLAAVEPYDAELLSQLPQLKCISRCGIGTDAIDLEAAKKYGKGVLVTVDEIVEPVAQMALAMILALARNFVPHIHDFKEGSWKKQTGFSMSELTVGLIGFGRIAKQLAKYLQPLGSPILVCDPFLKRGDFPTGIAPVDLDTLLSRSDLVSIHAARSAKEGVLLGANEFSKMKRGSFLVNTARGYMVGETALEEALKSGHLAGAALDVFEEEPYKGSLAKLPNVLCTPHVGTLTRGSRVAMELRCARNVVDFFSRMENR